MRRQPFVKMQGSGNDFVLIDARHAPFNLSPADIRHMADRHFGIGFDQLLVVEESSDARADFRYRIFNADGSEANQCGNGARCLGLYLRRQHLTNSRPIRLLTKKEIIELAFEADGEVKVDMGKPSFDPHQVPLDLSLAKPVGAREFKLDLKTEVVQFAALSLGNPHIVLKVEEIATAPVEKLGAALSVHPAFPEGVNVGFVEVKEAKNTLQLRVYERGAGETLSCGSGACAAAAIAMMAKWTTSPTTVHTRGGTLVINWQGKGHRLFMSGPAVEVFTGEISLSLHI